ncbi:MAG: ABC transporter ATP-binding protein/permease [Clostridia bacterium]
MIKINMLNKFFNKKKSNEIHVINDISLELPETGVVCLFGKSGSGKTTLLNAIGGLDSVDSGSIAFDNEAITKYSAKQWDKIRNEKIGYVFQNYNLIDTKSVEENIKVSLNLAGVLDDEEVSQRIDTALKLVGMINYKNRNVLALSGGQQQRVAIARALAKMPKVIIADEPTGNLDEKNTIAIMDILKSISKKVLVLLVTHEPRLVQHYADKVVEIVDGKIDNSYGLKANFDENIYLKDLQFKEEKVDNITIKNYTDNSVPSDICVKLIDFDGKLHIQVETAKKIVYIDKKSDIKLIDEHKEIIMQESKIDNEFLKDLKPITPGKKAKLEPFWTSFSTGLHRKNSHGKILSWITTIMLIACAIGMVITSSMFAGFYKVDEKFVSFAHKDEFSGMYISNEKSLNYNDLRANGVATLQKSNAVWFYNSLSTYNVNYSVTPKEKFAGERFICGKNSANSFEVIVSTGALKYCVQNKNNYYGMKQSFADSMDDFLNINVICNNILLKVSGIFENEVPIIYGDTSIIDCFISEHGLLLSKAKELGLVAKETVLNANELLVTPSFDIDNYKRNDADIYVNPYVSVINNEVENIGKYKNFDNTLPEKLSYQGKEIKIVYPDEHFWINDTRYCRAYFDDEEKGMQYLKDVGIDLQSTYNRNLERFKDEQLGYKILFSSVISGVLVALLIIIAAISRSNMISRIKEIGVKRAIGARKTDICKMFIFESFGNITLDVFVGFIIGSIITSKLAAGTAFFFYPFWVALLVLILMLGFSILIGMLPIFSLLRKTPAEILAKYDI